MANTMMALMVYFKVAAGEFKEFWASLSDDEKEYYKNADLS